MGDNAVQYVNRGLVGNQCVSCISYLPRLPQLHVGGPVVVAEGQFKLAEGIECAAVEANILA